MHVMHGEVVSTALLILVVHSSRSAPPPPSSVVLSKEEDTPPPVSDDGGHSEAALIKSLLDDYSSYGRPVKDPKVIVNVTVQPQIYSLIEVMEQEEMIRLLLWFPQSWTDEFLIWDPSEWGDIEKVNIPASLLWLPDGYIFNTVDMREPLTQLNARVSYKGKVEVDFNKLVDLRCPMDVLAFPFDEQKCSLQFGSWSYQINQLHHITRPTSVPEDSHNSEWEILSFTSDSVRTKYEGADGAMNEYEEIFFRLTLKRKPLYYIVVILIPTFVIVDVSIVGIFTPHGIQGDREEKVNLGLTTLLTMAVILDMVAGAMPKSSAGLPLLGRFVLAETVLSVFAILVSVVTIFAHERLLYLGTDIPRCFRDKEKEERTPLIMSPGVHELRSCIEELRGYFEEQKKDEQVKIFWQRVFSFVDIGAMIFFLIANCILTYYMFSFAI